MNIVLCDDHGIFLDALANALTGMDHRVIARTTDPDQLFDLVYRWRPQVSLLDVEFDQVTRLDLAEQVREASPTTRVVLLCGSLASRAWEAYDEGVADGLLCKTCDMETLDSTVRRVAMGERVAPNRRRDWSREASPIAELTDRERAVLTMIVAGANTGDIAASLGVSANTIRTHVQHVLDKLGVHSRAKAAALAAEAGLLTPLELQVSWA
jgi:DNA-binding NarL/FixJ family response regulator